MLFVPDTYLGKWVEKNLDDVEVITYNGYCPTHLRIRPDDIIKAKEKYPDALVLAHPECHIETAKLADFVGSTKEIIEYAKKSDNKVFLIATEQGVTERLNRDSKNLNWEKVFYGVKDNIICPNMKQNSLEDIYNVLLNETNEITIDETIREKAKECIDKMLLSGSRK